MQNSVLVICFFTLSLKGYFLLTCALPVYASLKVKILGIAAHAYSDGTSQAKEYHVYLSFWAIDSYVSYKILLTDYLHMFIPSSTLLTNLSRVCLEGFISEYSLLSVKTNFIASKISKKIPALYWLSMSIIVLMLQLVYIGK